MADPIRTPEVIDLQPITTAIAPYRPIVTAIEPREPRQRRSPTVTRRTRRAPAPSARRGGRPKKYSFRGVYNTLKKRLPKRWASKRKGRAEVGTTTRRKGKACNLQIGKIAICVLVGVSTGYGADLLVQRFVSKNRGVRLAFAGGLGLLMWFIAPAAGPIWGEFVKLMAVTHTVTGIIILGVEKVNEAAGALPAPAR